MRRASTPCSVPAPRESRAVEAAGGRAALWALPTTGHMYVNVSAASVFGWWWVTTAGMPEGLVVQNGDNDLVDMLFMQFHVLFTASFVGGSRKGGSVMDDWTLAVMLFI